MNISEYSIKHRAVIFFVALFILIGGIYSYSRLGKLEDPAFTVKTAVIITSYPGASPHEVEQQVTNVIEKAAQSADEVEEIRSISRAGISLVYVDLYERNRAKEMQQLWDMLRRKVSGCQRALPPGAGPSVVHDDYGDVYGIFLALTGDGFPYSELKNYGDYIKRELLLVEDVSRIQLFGKRTECIDIQVKRSKLVNLGIHPGRIMEVLSRQNEVLDAGAVETDTRRLRVVAPGEFQSVDEIKGLIVQGKNSEQFLLKDLADVSRGYVQPAEPMMRFNGRPAIGIAISAATGANVVTMGDAIQKRIDTLMADLPVGINLDGIYYQSKFVTRAIKQFVINLLESVAIVTLVLLIAMGIRSGLLIAGSLIFSILGTFIVMLAWGIDIHRVSLGALIIVMGMIVDNAIVVTDGSLVRLQKGEKGLSVFVGPPKETAWPLLGATIIACLAFMPIFLAPNTVGEFAAAIFQVVSIALLISWVLAMSLTPVFNQIFLRVKTGNTTKSLYSGRAYRSYRMVLTFSLKHRAFTLAVMVGLLILSGFGFKYVPKMFFDERDKAQFVINCWLPEGTRIEKVSQDLRMVERYLETLREVRDFTTIVGADPSRYLATSNPRPNNPSYGHLIVNVYDYRKIWDLIYGLEIWFASHIPEAELQIRPHFHGPYADFKIEARFSGPDPRVLRDIAVQVKEIMKKNSFAINIRDNWRERVQTWEPVYSQQKARKTGVERKDLASSMKKVTDGLPVTYFREGDDLLPVFVKTSTSMPSILSDLESMPVWGRGPVPVPLEQIVTETGIDWEDPVVHRSNRRRAISVQCDPRGVTPDTLLGRIRPLIESIPLPSGYHLEWCGDFKNNKKGEKGVNKSMPLALILMLFILVVLFNGFRQPMIIAMVVPLAIVGMTTGLFITQQPFSFIALLGAFSLIGMMIKNAVVLIDLIDAQIKSGTEPLQAVKDSCVSRLRPVMMASVTTIFGMIPLLTDVFFVSMAVTIMFGLAFATILTLIVVPVLYTLFFRIQIVSGRNRSQEVAPVVEDA